MLLLLLLSLLSPASALRHPDRISVDDAGNFVDGYGRVRIFRGINSVQKGPPWFTTQVLNSTLLDAYASWGFNAVRLGTMWAAAEPVRGEFNATYLRLLRRVVDGLAAKGFYCIMDMHQDVLTSKYEAYDGVPRWLVDSFPSPPLPYPWPLKRVEAWADGYLTWAVSSAFQHLYSNESASLTHWAEFWRRVAQSVSAQPRVLGYELINEPWAGDIFWNPARLLPGEAGAVNLMPAYEHLTKALTSVDPEALVFYEPVTWSLVVGGAGFGGTGFDRTPGNRTRHSALSYHYYCWVITEADEGRFYPAWERLACDSVLLRRNLANAEEARRRTGGAKFLTEFGLCAPSDLNFTTGTIECDEVLDQADENLQSWTYWDSNFTTADGRFNWSLVRPFARPYPMATAGQPLSIRFELTTGEFNFTFAHNPNVKADTVVFLPLSVHYPKGVNASVSAGFTFQLDGQLLRIRPDGRRRSRSGGIVRVTVTRSDGE